MRRRVRPWTEKKVRALIAHAEALGRRLRSDRVVARTITLKLKLARPLGGGRYPLLTRSLSLDRPTDDGAAIMRAVRSLLARAAKGEKIRLAGVQAHNLERSDPRQLGLFDPAAANTAARNIRLNRALDAVTRRFGEDAVTRGLARAERIAPTHRIK